MSVPLHARVSRRSFCGWMVAMGVGLIWPGRTHAHVVPGPAPREVSPTVNPGYVLRGSPRRGCSIPTLGIDYHGAFEAGLQDIVDFRLP